MIALVVAALATVNLAAFLLFWWDKDAARRGLRRVPEATLLWAAALGGSLGAVLGQRLLRHKTRKQPFAARLAMILTVQAAIALAAAWLVAKP